MRLLVAATGALALAGTSTAMAAPAAYKVTGGGQTFASSDVEDGKPTVKGPGDTITFQAFTNDAEGGESNATGQVNIIDRVAGATTAKGRGEHFKGVVTCAFIQVADPDKGGGYAELRGYDRDDANRFFRVRIMDDGQGKDTLDEVEFNTNFDDDENQDEAQMGECGDDDMDNPFETALARGNAKIHKVNGGASQSSGTQSKSSALSAAKLALL